MKLKAIKKSIWAEFLFVVVLFLLLVSAINVDTRKTAHTLCRNNQTFSRNSFCESIGNSFYDEFDDQFGFHFRFKQFLLSDVAFRNIFVPLGFSEGTMFTLNQAADGFCYTDKSYIPGYNYQSCLNDEDSANRTLQVYNRRILIYFSIWLIWTTTVMHRLIRLSYHKFSSRAKQ